MISFIAPLAAGNAVQLLVSPPAGARRWRVLRKRTDTISAVDDAGANVVYEGDDNFIIDRYALVNGTEYFYRAFYLLVATWVGSASRSAIPATEFSDISTDVVDIVRERMDLGFAAYTARGFFSNAIGHVPVLLATPVYEDASFPLVTVHMASCSPAERFVGEMLVPDTDYDDGTIGEVTGWLVRYQIQIVAWCMNGDVRADMRKAMSAIVKTNLPVFESTGMSLIEDQYSDDDDMNTYPAPMYRAICTLSCIAPSAVESLGSTVQESFVVSN